MKYFPPERNFHINEERNPLDYIDDFDDVESNIDEGDSFRKSSLAEDESPQPVWLRDLNWSSLADDISSSEYSSSQYSQSLKRPNTTRTRKYQENLPGMYSINALKTGSSKNFEQRRRKFSGSSCGSDFSSQAISASPYANTFKGVKCPDLNLTSHVKKNSINNSGGLLSSQAFHSSPSLMLTSGKAMSSDISRPSNSLKGGHGIVSKIPTISPIHTKSTPALRKLQKSSLLQDAFNAPIVIRNRNKKKQTTKYDDMF
jgi:hypothetical protein